MPNATNATTRVDALAAIAQMPTDALTARYRAVLTDGSARTLVADRRADRDAMDVRVHRVPAAAMVNAIASHTGWTKAEVRAEYGVPCSHESRQSCKCPARGMLRTEYIAIKEGRRA